MAELEERETGVGVDAIKGSADVEALDEDMVENGGRSSSGGAEIPSSACSQSI